MTDKQIIIDGCDVSYCPNHYNGWSALHRDLRPMCECGYDRECKPKDFECSHYVKCLEKQLKAKEQECEKLKNWVKNMMFDTDRNDWFEHFAECFENWKEDLFKQLDQLKKENEELKYKAEFFENYNNAHIDKITKLEKTLTEIKELCQKHIKAEKIVMANDILQKISEVENDNA